MRSVSPFVQAGQYLLTQQEPEGGFVSWSSPHLKTLDSQRRYHTVFITAQILQALAELPTPYLPKALQKSRQRIVSQGISFLLSHCSPQGTWNYWARTSSEYTQLPYPDDLDDTFVAARAIKVLQPDIFSGKQLAQLVSCLTATEVEAGGPYKTWLVSQDMPAMWRDIDLVVNSNIAAFLATEEVTLPNVVELADKAINTNTLTTPYYPTPFPAYYSLSLWYTGPQLSTLQKSLITAQTQPGWWGTAMDTALAALSLVHWHQSQSPTIPAPVVTILRRARQKLLAAQLADGSWPASGFCIDPSIQGTTHYAGSPTLSTAWCLAAVTNLEILLQTKTRPTALSNQVATLGTGYVPTRLLSKINHNLHQRTQHLPPSLLVPTQTLLEKTLASDSHHEITLLPWFFSQALVPTTPSSVAAQSGSSHTKHATHRSLQPHSPSSQLLTTLGAANMLGWMAYRVFDDFLDEEGQLTQLPAATWALRELTQIYTTHFPARTHFSQFFNQVMAQLDAANAWEVSHTRASVTVNGVTIPAQLPEYTDLSQLAHRSLGHALGPVAVLVKIGYSLDSPAVTLWWQFAHHYLIARQLNDDLHDWERDLLAGHLNAVVVTALSEFYAAGHTTRVFSSQNLNPLRQIFWQQAVPQLARTIKHQLKMAQSALTTNPAITQTALTPLIKKVDQSIKNTLTQREKTIEFLSGFETNP